jgi:uncharacterized protein YaeQ
MKALYAALLVFFLAVIVCDYRDMARLVLVVSHPSRSEARLASRLLGWAADMSPVRSTSAANTRPGYWQRL